MARTSLDRIRPKRRRRHKATAAEEHIERFHRGEGAGETCRISGKRCWLLPDDET